MSSWAYSLSKRSMYPLWNMKFMIYNGPLVHKTLFLAKIGNEVAKS